jgi:hypothetical protein
LCSRGLFCISQRPCLAADRKHSPDPPEQDRDECQQATLTDVIKVHAYLLDWNDYADFNSAYQRWFPERLPSRTCVGVHGLAADALVEIDLVAWRAGGWI